LIIEIVGRL
jgi:hypothetical protein